MIDFSLAEDLQLIEATAQRFAADKLRPGARLAEKQGCVPHATVEAFAELGLGLVDLPEAFGGLGLGLVAATLVAEALAHGDAGASLALPQPGAYARLLRLAAPQAAKRGLAAFVETPLETRGAVALGAEPGVRAARHADGWVLRGRVDFVLGAPGCDRLLVLANAEGHDLAQAALFDVRLPAAGVSLGARHDTVGLQAVSAAAVQLDDVRIDAAARLGSDDPAALLDRFFATEGLVTAARAIGVSQAAYAYALAYAHGRQAFGKPIAHFQSIAFLLADMLIAVEGARACVRHAAWACDADRPEAVRLCVLARAQADEAATFVTDNAVQILGGHGFIQDHPVEKWMRDVKMLALCFGSRESADCRLAVDLLDGAFVDTLPLGPMQPVWT